MDMLVKKTLRTYGFFFFMAYSTTHAEQFAKK